MRRVLLFSAALTGSVLLTATPAHADHVIDILSDGSTCRAGRLETGIGVDLLTSKVTFRLHEDGWVRSYTCRFDDVPDYVPASDFFPAWTLPARKTSFAVSCWRQGGERYDGTGIMTIKPNGTASVTCNFVQAPG